MTKCDSESYIRTREMDSNNNNNKEGAKDVIESISNKIKSGKEEVKREDLQCLADTINAMNETEKQVRMSCNE